jgi:hypothetical protein
MWSACLALRCDAPSRCDSIATPVHLLCNSQALALLHVQCRSFPPTVCLSLATLAATITRSNRKLQMQQCQVAAHLCSCCVGRPCSSCCRSAASPLSCMIWASASASRRAASRSADAASARTLQDGWHIISASQASDAYGWDQARWEDNNLGSDRELNAVIQVQTGVTCDTCKLLLPDTTFPHPQTRHTSTSCCCLTWLASNCML